MIEEQTKRGKQKNYFEVKRMLFSKVFLSVNSSVSQAKQHGYKDDDGDELFLFLLLLLLLFFLLSLKHKKIIFGIAVQKLFSV